MNLHAPLASMAQAFQAQSAKRPVISVQMFVAGPLAVSNTGLRMYIGFAIEVKIWISSSYSVGNDSSCQMRGVEAIGNGPAPLPAVFRIMLRQNTWEPKRLHSWFEHIKGHTEGFPG